LVAQARKFVGRRRGGQPERRPDDTELALVRLAGSPVAAISLLAAGVATMFVALIAAAGVAPPAMSAPVARSFATIESWLHSGEET
jgi:hypothetical protein